MPNNNDEVRNVTLTDEELDRAIAELDSIGTLVMDAPTPLSGYITFTNTSITDNINLNSSKLTSDYITGEIINKSDAIKVFTKLLPDLSDVDRNSPVVYTRHLNKVLKIILENEREVLVSIDPRPLLRSKKFIELLGENTIAHESKINKAEYFRHKKLVRTFRPTKARKVDPIYFSKTYTLTEGKRYTFGLELETISGYLPHWVDQFYNYEAVKDGSLRDENGDLYGGEYVTNILAGDEGFKVAKSFINELSDRCLVDKKCGVHVHLGTENGFSNETIVFLYKLCLDVEKDIFNMLPPSRRRNTYCKTLHKFNFKPLANATNPIVYNKELETLYNSIAKWVSNREDFNPALYSKFSQHPDGPKCGYNHSTARYCWVNLVPALFNTRGNDSYTIEFRPHSGTLNYIKIRNWTLICMGILYVAENYQGLIKNKQLTLKEVIELAYPKKHLELNKYIEVRTNLFSDKEYKEILDYQDNNNDQSESLRNI
jgi:hypothetical protein